jgi:hypothetical protein
MVHLGDPTRDVEVLPDPVPIAPEIMPEEVSVNGIVRFFLKRMNKKWEGDKIFFDREHWHRSTISHPLLSLHVAEPD